MRPLIRRTGKFLKATKIWEFLTTRGRAFQSGRDYFRYGYTPGTGWIEKLHHGGVFLGKAVPPRPVLGLTRHDLDVIERIYATGVDKRLQRGLK